MAYSCCTHYINFVFKGVTLVITDLQSQFKATVAISEDFISLMQKSFQFYAELCADFFEKLPNNVQNQSLSNYLKDELSNRLFDDNYCASLEATKKRFLAENIKLEQFQASTKYNAEFLNDLEKLKKVSDEIYQLLQHHWELYKYKRSFIDEKTLITFILEIDRIGISWDSYLENYLAVAKVLKIASNNPSSLGHTLVELKYHIPENEKITLTILAEFIQFLKLSYEFIHNIYGGERNEGLEVSNITVLNPLHCSLLVPNALSESFSKFMHYLSVDVIKKETLLKFVMEVLRLQQGLEISKQAITNFQKKLSKQLDQLHPEGYISVISNMEKDSVEILQALCSDMDELKVQYKDLLLGSSQTLARSRVRKNIVPSKQEAVAPFETKHSEEKKQDQHFSRTIDLVKIEPDKSLKFATNRVDSVEKAALEGEEKNKDIEKPKVNVIKKEHIGFLTS